jgi:hypothetical protein
MIRYIIAALLLGILPANAASEGFTITTCGTLANQYTALGFNAMAIDINGNTCINGTITSTPATPAAGTLGAGYPPGATPITGNATGSTAAVTGTLAASATKFTYICGFNVSAIGGTATVGPVTVAGLIGSSQVYQLPVNATAGQLLLTQNFNPCIPSSAINTAITVTTTADATASAVDVNSWGYQQ